MKESILNLQSRSVRDHLVFTDISEHINDNPEQLVKNFTDKQLKLPTDTVNNIPPHSSSGTKKTTSLTLHDQ